MPDVAIIGGGVIGLSLAYELSRRGRTVVLVDRGPLAREASWAGAGILPPANATAAVHPWDTLRALSHQLHADWAAQLHAETGIDNGYRRCGGVYLAESPGEAAALTAFARQQAALGIEVRPLSVDQLDELEPELRPPIQGGRPLVAYLFPDEAQVRNPHHLRALRVACQQRGVQFREQVAVSVGVSDGGVVAVTVDDERLAASQVCVAAGAWSFGILNQLGCATGLLPIRGQMVLLHARPGLLHHVLNVGPRYLVPRDDGRLLVGSTEEEVGFDKRDNPASIRELTTLAARLVPALHATPIERTWTGLRPATYDGQPYLGRIPGTVNGFVAAGHFRSGLHLSPGTAVVMCDLLQGEAPCIDLSPFYPGRG